MDGFKSAVQNMVSGCSLRQKTLKGVTECEGTALHSGNLVKMRLCPAEPNSGIRFRRVDIDPVIADITASFGNVVDTRLSTTIANMHGVKVSTIEHLMAALSGCELDNLVVELDAEEVPVMDGSAAPFIDMIEKVGILAQKSARKRIRVLRSVSVNEGSKFLELKPSKFPSINLEIDFDCEVIGHQSFALPMTKAAILECVSKARTFGFLHEVEALRKSGLALGGSLENAVVISDGEILNTEGLRFPDEFIRHKILDCIGDLYLAGAPIIGSVIGSGSGHTLNNALLQALFDDEDAWDWDTEDSDRFVDFTHCYSQTLMSPA